MADSKNVMQIDVPAANDPQTPTCERRFNGPLLNIQDLFSPQTYYVFYAINDLAKNHGDFSLNEWTYILTKSNLENIRIEFEGRTYTGVSPRGHVQLCFELFGFGLPESWKAPPGASNIRLLTTLKSINKNLPNALTDLRNMTDQQWMETKNIIREQAKAPEVAEKVATSCLTALYALCRTGSPSFTSKLINRYRTKTGLRITLYDPDIKEIWRLLAPILNNEKAQAAIEFYLSAVDKDVKGIDNLLQYAKTRRLTQFYKVQEAMSQCPDFYWNKVYSAVPGDFQNYKEALKFIGNRYYMGYNTDLGPATASKYNTLAYICVEICRRVLNQDSLSCLVTSKQFIDTEYWNGLINKFIYYNYPQFSPEAKMDTPEASAKIHQLLSILTLAGDERDNAVTISCKGGVRCRNDSSDDDNDQRPGFQ